MTNDLATLAAFARLAMTSGFPAGVSQADDGQYYIFIVLPDGRVTWPIAPADLRHFTHLVARDGMTVDIEVPAEKSRERLESFARRRDTQPMSKVIP